MISVLLTQIIVILLAAWLGGRLFSYLGQPQVVGEMTVGLVLGQIGSCWLGSTDALNTLSQIGLLLFLFLIGLRFNPDHLMRESRLALAVSAASIVVPFVLGSALGLVLYAGLQDGSSRTGFSLFLGAAMSITAFPVLARILQERRMEATRVGTLAIACAAVNDVVAWSLLAGILAFVRSHLQHRPFWQSLLLVSIFSTAVWLGRGRLTQSWNSERLTVILLAIFTSSLATEWIGVHAFFGAFVAGVLIPKTASSAESVTRRIEPLTKDLLLPLFFTLTGFRARVGLVQGWRMWGVCLLIICIAVLGKWGGAAFTARWMGMPWRDASALGILLNTRGLVELIVLNTGLDAGLISPALFSMMVIMAIVTTAMASPALSLFPALPQTAQEK